VWVQNRKGGAVSTAVGMGGHLWEILATVREKDGGVYGKNLYGRSGGRVGGWWGEKKRGGDKSWVHIGSPTKSRTIKARTGRTAKAILDKGSEVQEVTEMVRNATYLGGEGGKKTRTVLKGNQPEKGPGTWPQRKWGGNKKATTKKAKRTGRGSEKKGENYQLRGKQVSGQWAKRNNRTGNV